MHDNDEIELRPLRTDDAEAASLLLDQLGYAVRPEVLRRRIQAVAESASAEALVATDRDDNLVALASLHRLTLLTENAPLAYLTSLVVAEHARGKGVGRRLVHALCDRARDLGCERLVLTTHVRRAEAHAFYERLGFEFTGRRYVLILASGG